VSSNTVLLKDKFERGLSQLPYLWRGLGLIWKAAPGWSLAWLVLLVFQGMLPVATVNLTRLLVDSLVAVTQKGSSWENLRSVLLLAGLMGLVLLVGESLRGLVGLIRTVQSESVQDHVSGLIHAKSAEIDLAFYDSPDYYDHLHRARTGAAYRSLGLLESIGALLQNGITLVAMAFVLLPYGAWLPLALLISTIPAFLVVLQHRLRLHHWTVKNTPLERRAWYYDWLLTTRENAAEIRLFQLGDYIQDAYRRLRARLRGERQKLARQQGLAELGAGVLALLVTGLAMAWMIWRLTQGESTLGDLALFYSAFNQGQGLMRSFMENMGEIYTNSFFLSDLFEFLTLERQLVEPPVPLPVPRTLDKGLSFENVTFYYPGSQRPALRNFNLEVQPGQVAAIVGANGAGKSTLIKLLCRFYDPNEGLVTLDGVDLRKFSTDDLRANITILFQEPVNYNDTAAENIGMGNLTALEDRERIEAAARSAGADEPILRLPQGYDTLLGKWFQGGVDLSVGEWQRIALARAFMRQAALIVLDEPTSAMDPWAETDWLERFRRLASGRTAVLITHRFTTAAYADVIHVMEAGRIIESGRHDELLAKGGRYAQSWHAQMRRWLEASNPVRSGEASA
jgi:ATP-binding cassette subfamily B protein